MTFNSHFDISILFYDVWFYFMTLGSLFSLRTILYRKEKLEFTWIFSWIENGDWKTWKGKNTVPVREKYFPEILVLIFLSCNSISCLSVIFIQGIINLVFVAGLKQNHLKRFKTVSDFGAWFCISLFLKCLVIDHS